MGVKREGDVVDRVELLFSPLGDSLHFFIEMDLEKKCYPGFTGVPFLIQRRFKELHYFFLNSFHG
jgi:hypothetical protein